MFREGDIVEVIGSHYLNGHVGLVTEVWENGAVGIKFTFNFVHVKKESLTKTSLKEAYYYKWTNEMIYEL